MEEIYVYNELDDKFISDLNINQRLILIDIENNKILSIIKIPLSETNSLKTILYNKIIDCIKDWTNYDALISFPNTITKYKYDESFVFDVIIKITDIDDELNTKSISKQQYQIIIVDEI